MPLFLVREIGRAAFAAINADNFGSPQGFQSHPEPVIAPRRSLE